MREWWDAVAAVKRANPATKHRVMPRGVYDARGAPRSMSLKEEDAMDDIIQAVVAWNGHDSSCLVVDDVDGVKEFTNTQLGHQLWLCGSEVEGKEQPPVPRRCCSANCHPTQASLGQFL